jgi:hypothetical protein
VEIRPTGQQHMSQREVDAFLQDVRMNRTKKSPQVLQINQVAMMKAKNNGFPRDLYHETLEMRQALSEEDQVALLQAGYHLEYVPQHYPKWIHRRNMADKFAEIQDSSCPTILNNAFVESRMVKTEDEEKRLRAQKPPAGAGPWCNAVGDIDPLPETEYVDPAQKIAQLEGALAEAQRQTDKTRKTA